MDAPTETASAPAPATEMSDADLMGLAQRADSGEDIAPQPSSANTAPDTTNTEADPAVSDSAQKAAEQKPAQEQKPNPDQTAPKETPFQKAKSDSERRDRSWKALEEEKRQFREERTRVETELKSLREQVQRLSAPPTPVTDENGATAETYDALAAKYEREENPQMAALAKERAQQLRAKERQPVQPTAPAVEPYKTPEFKQKWEANVQEIITAEPELNDPQHPVFQGVSALLKNKDYAPLLLASPNGIRAAVEVAKLQIQAQQVPKLTDKIKAHEAEISRLTKLLSPQGSRPGAQASAQRPEDISDDELLAKAIAADQGG